jgi:putative membrane-bound dehydrogenase-like protein
MLLAAAGFLAVPARAADLPPPPDTEHGAAPRLSAAEAAAGFQTPPGFHVQVFAAEPDVRNPVALAWDPRGRLWVAENYTYSDRDQHFDLRLRDRVLIFEDADRDGRFERRTVFTDEVQYLSSVEVGLGGTWLLCPPNLLFIPDRDGNDVPDGPAEVLLDGFAIGAENYHTFVNGLRLGPDGWLYGRCGASCPAQVGAPGTPDAQRIPLRGGFWRYHPHTKRFEVLCHGTTNPWGHDWNAVGEAFFINTVNGHLWHVIPGAHFVRPHTIDPNPRAYGQIDQHADHYHWDNSKELKSPYKPSAEDTRRGGGHAHVGLMIYQGDQWPDEFRGKLFTLNLHGRRMNVERLERSGTGYVGRHEPDTFFAADLWFRGIDLSYGPDGGVFVLDWSDTGECHERDGIHRNSGRIYKITHGEPPRAVPADLTRLDEPALVAMHRHANEWYVRQARRVLADRAARGEPLTAAKAALRDMFEHDAEISHKIGALGSLFTIGGADVEFLRPLLHHDHESVRTWAIRLLTDAMPLDTVFSQRISRDVELAPEVRSELISVAHHDHSGLVLLALGSTLQRLPIDQRQGLARALLRRAEYASDPNLPALVWTALIPVAESDPHALVSLAPDCRLQQVARWIARRLGEDIETRPGPLNALLFTATLDSAPASASAPLPGGRPAGRPIRPSANLAAEILQGLSDALTGWHKAKKPDNWERFVTKLGEANDESIANQVRDLNVLFGDGRALDEVRRLALDESAAIASRKAALRTLVENRPPDLRAICEKLVRVRFLNPIALRGLALFDDPAIGRTLASNSRSFHPSERAALYDTLVSRPTFALALLDQIAQGKLPRQELSAFHVRQLRSLPDPRVAARMREVWGATRDTPADRRARIDQLKARLDARVMARSDLSRGRATFDRVCASCHTLHGRGGSIGPDLTGANRDNMDYLLENLVDPSASVSADFRMSVVAMRDGRVLNGMIKAQTDRTLTLQGQTEALTLDRTEIDDVKPSVLSLMPDGLLDPLSESETRDLIAYLMHRTQVALPARLGETESPATPRK